VLGCCISHLNAPVFAQGSVVDAITVADAVTIATATVLSSSEDADVVSKTRLQQELLRFNRLEIL